VNGDNTDKTDLFLALTPDRVLDAVEHSGLRCNPVCYPLNSFENRVYEVELEDRSRVVAKFYRPGRWSRAQILEEHAYMEQLRADEISICPTHRFPNGATLEEIDGIYYCLYDRFGGRAPEELSDEHAARLGMLTARMHIVGAREQATHRRHLNADTFGRECIDWLADHETLPDRIFPRYEAAAEAIANAAEQRMEGVELQRVHGDLHLSNLLLRDGVFHVLDFDDMTVAPAVQDVWLLLPGRDQYTRRQREIFIESYQQLRAFDRSTLNLIEPLRGLRLIHYATWLAKRWHDPIFPRTWPHFGTEEYWDNQTRDLEEIVDLIRAESGVAPIEKETELLSNADYFFDWEE